MAEEDAIIDLRGTGRMFFGSQELEFLFLGSFKLWAKPQLPVPRGLAAEVIFGPVSVVELGGGIPVGLVAEPLIGKPAVSGVSGVAPISIAAEPEIGSVEAIQTYALTVGASSSNRGMNGNVLGDGSGSWGSINPGSNAASVAVLGVLAPGGTGGNTFRIRFSIDLVGGTTQLLGVTSFVVNLEGWGPMTMTWNAANGSYDAVGSSAGAQGIMAYLNDNVGNVLGLSGIPDASAPLPLRLSIIGEPDLDIEVDVPYEGFTVSAADGTGGYVYSLVGEWPAGITVDSGTGEVSGTPTVAGAFPGLSVRVTDSSGQTSDLDVFLLTVTESGPSVINATSTASGTLGTPAYTEDDLPVLIITAAVNTNTHSGTPPSCAAPFVEWDALAEGTNRAISVYYAEITDMTPVTITWSNLNGVRWAIAYKNAERDLLRLLTGTGTAMEWPEM